jgi:SAM-dependent methyltransferase
MESGEQRSFWDRHITAWSASAYEPGKKLPLIERIAQPFRKHLQERQDMAVAMLLKWSPLAVLELGCGTGEFVSAALKASSTIKRYVAIDISDVAVVKAGERVRQSAGNNVNAAVKVSSVEDLDPSAFHDFDVIVGLGLLPYLTDAGFEKLSAICRGRSFLLDDHPKEPTLFNGLHFFYRKAKSYPFYRIFSEAELKEIMARFGFARFEIIRKGPLRFMRSV